MTTPLFAYGTLRNPLWRSTILGADYPARRATLYGWTAVALASGYLCAIPRSQSSLGGALIDLDDLGWRIADAWEEVPRYRRTPVVVETRSGSVAAAIYVVPAITVGAPIDGERFAALDDARVAQAIAAFTPTMQALRAGRRF